MNQTGEYLRLEMLKVESHEEPLAKGCSDDIAGSPCAITTQMPL